MICAAALVLLLDASASISTTDWATQLGGHATAIEAPEVTRLLPRGPVAVTARAFGDHTAELAGWRVLATVEDARAYAAELRQARRPMGGGTLVGHAIRDAIRAHAASPCTEVHQVVIDVVSDGEADARETSAARDEAYALGIRINVLGVGPESAATWLRAHAMTPGGFGIQVAEWSDFGGAIVRKVSLEIAGR